MNLTRMYRKADCGVVVDIFKPDGTLVYREYFMRNYIPLSVDTGGYGKIEFSDEEMEVMFNICND